MIFITFKTWHISCATGVFLHCEFSLTDESLLMHSWPAVIHRHFSQIPGFWGRILSRINPHWNQNSSVAVISHIFTWLLHTLNSGAWLGGVNLICHLLGQEQGENEHFKHFKISSFCPANTRQGSGIKPSQGPDFLLLHFNLRGPRICFWAVSVRKVWEINSFSVMQISCKILQTRDFGEDSGPWCFKFCVQRCPWGKVRFPPGN